MAVKVGSCSVQIRQGSAQPLGCANWTDVPVLLWESAWGDHGPDTSGVVSPESDICQMSAESDKREPKPFGGRLRTAEGRGGWRGWSVKWCVLAQPMSLLNCLEFPIVFKTIDTNPSLSSFLKSCFQWLCSGKILCFPWLIILGLGPGDAMQLVPPESLAQPARPAGVLWVQTQRQAHEAPANGGGQCLALGTAWTWLFALAFLWPKDKCRGSSGSFALGQRSGKASMQRHNFPFLWLGFDVFCFCSCVWCQPDLCSWLLLKNESQKYPYLWSLVATPVIFTFCFFALLKSSAEKLTVLHLQLCHVNEKTALKWIKSRQKIEWPLCRHQWDVDFSQRAWFCWCVPCGICIMAMYYACYKPIAAPAWCDVLGVLKSITRAAQHVPFWFTEYSHGLFGFLESAAGANTLGWQVDDLHRPEGQGGQRRLSGLLDMWSQILGCKEINLPRMWGLMGKVFCSTKLPALRRTEPRLWY